MSVRGFVSACLVDAYGYRLGMRYPSSIDDEKNKVIREEERAGRSKNVHLDSHLQVQRCGVHVRYCCPRNAVLGLLLCRGYQFRIVRAVKL